jgi:pyruvate dehydrogenase E2 component (dihydrolipoamide acetyltransferase)
MDVVMPQLGETVAEGKISAWFKAAGDAVKAGDNLFEIETDKVTMEVQATSAGILSDIRVQTGETVPVGTVVATIGEAGAAAAAPAARAEPASLPPLREAARGGPAPESQAPSPATLSRGTNGGAAPSRTDAARKPFKIAPFAETNTPTGNYGKTSAANGLKITPLARRLIAQNGIDLGAVAEAARSRGAWRIAKSDVEHALRNGGARQAAAPATTARPPAPASGFQPFNNIRRQTAERLTQSWQTIPHAVQAMEIDFAAVEAVRSARKADFQARNGVALTYLPFIARAVAMAIPHFPRVNARVEGQGVALSPAINLGFAVDLSHEGLVVPVVRDAGDLTAAGIARALGRLTEKARAGKLTPDDYSGGTYSITNNGSFGTLFTAPIINPPQVAILSTDAIRKRPVVVESAGGDAIAIHPVGTIAQSFDHRAFDGAYSAAFLSKVKSFIETHDWAAEIS